MPTFRVPSLDESPERDMQYGAFIQHRPEESSAVQHPTSDVETTEFSNHRATSPYASDSDGSTMSFSDSEYTHDTSDEEDHQPWRLELPIYGMIAFRRALGRGEDPFDIQRQQRSQLHHELELRSGPLKDVDTSFRAVDFQGSVQLHSRLARIRDGEPVSPKSIARVEQMSLKEYNQAFGIEEDDRVMVGAESEQGSMLEHEESSFELEDGFGIRPFSAPSAECYLIVNPFDGQPSTA